MLLQIAFLSLQFLIDLLAFILYASLIFAFTNGINSSKLFALLSRSASFLNEFYQYQYYHHQKANLICPFSKHSWHIPLDPQKIPT